jgi:hypothetical protein
MNEAHLRSFLEEAPYPVMRVTPLLRRAGVYLGIWTLVAVYMICGEILMMRDSLQVDSLVRFAGLALVRNYGWAIVSLLTLGLVRAFPLHQQASPRAWLVHLFASVGITLLGIAIMAAEMPFYYAPRYAYLPRVWVLTKQDFHFCFLVYYWGVVGCHEGIQVFRRLKERQQAALLLQSRLAQAQLQALEMHLSPHFLFNTLNAVAALIHSDPGRADGILIKLSQLLRTSLNRSNEQVATLNDELAFLETYLDIERLRFGPRLRIDIQVPPALLEALVPTFMIQPLVEHAIKQGVAPRASGGRVGLRARTEGFSLILELEDEGRVSPASSADFQVFLNARSRLQQLYGDTQKLERLAGPGGGGLVRISLPFSPAQSTWIRSGGLP